MAENRQKPTASNKYSLYSGRELTADTFNLLLEKPEADLVGFLIVTEPV